MKVLTCALLLVFITAINAAPRIAGGSDAPDHKYPFVASIRTYPHRHFCTGTILNKRWILTVATCLKDDFSGGALNPLLVTVQVGSNELSGPDGQVYQADKIIYHKDYNYARELNNIGLVRVDRDIVFSKEVQPVTLPKQDNYKDNISAVAVGWGSTGIGGSVSSKLQEITVNIISQKKCQDYWSKTGLININITKMHICSLTEYQRGSCENDGGNPLIVDGVQVGSFAFMNGCGKGYPEGYTRIFTFLDWIKENAVIP